MVPSSSSRYDPAGCPRRWGWGCSPGLEPWRQPEDAGRKEAGKRQNIKISGRSAASGYSVIELKHLIKLKPLITGCRHVGVIYSNCGSGMEEQMFPSCWCHGMSSKGGGGVPASHSCGGRGEDLRRAKPKSLHSRRRWRPHPRLPQGGGAGMHSVEDSYFSSTSARMENQRVRTSRQVPLPRMSLLPSYPNEMSLPPQSLPGFFQTHRLVLAIRRA